MGVQIMSFPEINTVDTFKHNWSLWRVLGMQPTKQFKFIYYIYSVVINIMITIFYPMTLVIQVFLSANIKQFLETLTLTATNVACSFKQINAFLNRQDLIAINDLLSKLDRRVDHRDEKAILRKMMKTSSRLFYIYFSVYVSTGILSEIATVFASTRRLMYPAWFPFDWKANNFNYWCANIYQFTGIMVGILQEVVNDTYPAIYAGVLTGHIQTLMLRIQRIGTDIEKSSEENYNELIKCIWDYQELMRYHKILQTITSHALLIQFFVTGLVACLTAVYVLFVNTTTFDMVYLGFYFACVIMEILLSCYYGNELRHESHYITNAIYACDWSKEDRKFKKVLVIFMQSTQKDMTLIAGGVVNVNLESFMSLLKSSYSLFAVLIKVA